MHEFYLSVLEQQMHVRGRYVNSARLNLFSVDCMRHRQLSSASQYLGQHAGSICRDMKNDEYSRRQVSRQIGNQLQQGLNASGGSSDNNDVARGHKPPRVIQGKQRELMFGVLSTAVSELIGEGQI